MMVVLGEVRPAAVADASPLIVLAKSGCLDLLQALQSPIAVPRSVADEIRAKVPPDPAAESLMDPALVSIIENPMAPERIQAWQLGLGETAVISACLERSGKTIAILDDLAARRCAESVGVPVTGTAGLVVAARRRGQVEDVRPIIQRLLDAGLFLSENLIRSIVERAESD